MRPQGGGNGRRGCGIGRQTRTVVSWEGHKYLVENTTSAARHGGRRF
jgi:hypothetical protein